MIGGKSQNIFCVSTGKMTHGENWGPKWDIDQPFRSFAMQVLLAQLGYSQDSSEGEAD